MGVTHIMGAIDPYNNINVFFEVVLLTDYNYIL